MASNENRADSWVRERRLRPIYELLDSGNNKKVIAEADKLLKKQSNFTCVKVLKALALVRLNKVEDARQILDPVIEEAPTDDGTIQALSICYRELEEPAILSQILEAACKKEQSEELLTHCFMAQVRIQEHQKQHKTALGLYKLFNKPTYFGWAVASLVAKFDQVNPQSQKQDLTAMLPLQVAERMMDKFSTDQNSMMDECILELYLRILYKLGNWEKLLKVMTDHGYPQPGWVHDQFHEYYCTTLKQLNQTDELFSYLKSAYFANPDEFELLKDIVTTFGRTRKDDVLSMLDHLRESQPSRVVALADLQFCNECLEFEECSARVIEDFKMVVKYGADKLSFYSDTADYFKLLDEESAKSILAILDPSRTHEELQYDSAGKILTDISFEMLDREYSFNRHRLDRLRRADRCMAKYLVCEVTQQKLRGAHNLRTKESDYNDQFLVLAASSLIAEYCSTGNDNDIEGGIYQMARRKLEWIWKAQDLAQFKSIKARLQKPTGADLDKLSESFNSLSVHDNFDDDDRILVLIIAILVLEYGLKRSPYNHSFRILLAKSYTQIGATLSALKVIQQLDLKHVQWDTLGYLILFDAITGGMYQEASRMLIAAESMYSGYKRESMEHVITAYKYGSFYKIPEFLKFRQQLLESSQYGLVFVEKRLLEYLTNTNTPSELKKVAETIGKELPIHLLTKNSFTDNRDFTVLQNLAEDVDLNSLKLNSAETYIQYYKIRIALLFSLTKMVTHLANLDNVEEREEVIKCITEFEANVGTWENLYSCGDHHQNSVHTPMFHKLWPLQSVKYNELGCLSSLGQMLGYVKKLLTSEDVDDPSCEAFKMVVTSNCNKIFQHLTDDNNQNRARALSKLGIDASFTNLHHALETISFARIIVECVAKIDKRRLEVWKMDTKKKGRMTVLMSHKKVHSECVLFLHSRARDILNYIDNFRDKLKTNKVNGLRAGREKCDILLRPGFLHCVLGETYDVFCENMAENLKAQPEDMRKVAQNLADYLKHLET